MIALSLPRRPSGVDQECREMKIPSQLRDCYHQWLLDQDRPHTKFTQMQIPRKGGKVAKGLKLPRPDGQLWRTLRDKATLGKPLPASVKAFNATQLNPENATSNLVHQSQYVERGDISHYRDFKMEESQNTHLATQVVHAWQAIAQNGALNEFQDQYIDGLLTARHKQPHRLDRSTYRLGAHHQVDKSGRSVIQNSLHG